MGAKLTVEELAKLPDDDLFHELDEGELISRLPSGVQHGDVGAEITCLLANHVKENSLGRCYGANTGFLLGPDTVRAPDAAFVRKARLGQSHHRTFFPGAPDLAVEVFSPTDSVPQLMRKVNQYLKAGSHTVWIVYPETKEVHVFEAAGVDRILKAADLLEAPDILPGLSVPIASCSSKPMTRPDRTVSRFRGWPFHVQAVKRCSRAERVYLGKHVLLS